MYQQTNETPLPEGIGKKTKKKTTKQPNNTQQIPEKKKMKQLIT